MPLDLSRRKRWIRPSSSTVGCFVALTKASVSATKWVPLRSLKVLWTLNRLASKRIQHAGAPTPPHAQAAGLGDVPVGTVDKFQGREAPVVFYSMATSSAEDVPRTLDFLFSRNRLNVAVSRAMCLACIVASPRLLESRARTIEQMRLINALCRFAEMAEGKGT